MTEILQRVRMPRDVQDRFLTLLKRGGKAFWSGRDAYAVALALRQEVVDGHMIALYTGAALPDPLMPDGGGL